MSWTALLLAGRRPGVDPLAAANGTGLKALIEVGGQPMVARVAETLLAVPGVSRVLVLTQDVEPIRAVIPVDARLHVLRSEDGISRSVMAAAGGEEAPWPVLVTTADHPLLQRETVAAFLRASMGADVSVAAVERETLRARFPKNRRTWLKFGDGWWTGANLFALTGPDARALLEVWSGVEADRKKGWKLVARFGPVLLARALTRTIGFGDAVAAAGRRFGVDARLVPLADPLAAVDVDKPSDLQLARAVFDGTA